MSAFVILLAGRRYVAHARGFNTKVVPPGWRPFIWVADLTDAEKFGSREAAETFAASALPHRQFEIIEIAAKPGPSRKEFV
jgi:hypothetical protein